MSGRGSLFDMNQPERLCPICMELHIKTNPCRYDTLVRNIHTLKENIVSLLKANREATEIASTFQKIIRDMIPETERLVEIEKKYNELLEKTGVKNGESNLG